jgi:hypothetical protein
MCRIAKYHNSPTQTNLGPTKYYANSAEEQVCLGRNPDYTNNYQMDYMRPFNYTKRDASRLLHSSWPQLVLFKLQNNEVHTRFSIAESGSVAAQ